MAVTVQWTIVGHGPRSVDRTVVLKTVPDVFQDKQSSVVVTEAEAQRWSIPAGQYVHVSDDPEGGWIYRKGD